MYINVSCSPLLTNNIPYYFFRPPLLLLWASFTYRPFIYFHSRKCFENVTWKMGTILAQPQWVNKPWVSLLLVGSSSHNDIAPWFVCKYPAHYERDGVSNHQPHDCLLNGLFRRRSKKTSKLHVTGLCVGNSPVTGEFPAQRASNAENVSFDDVIMNAACHHWRGAIPPPVCFSSNWTGQTLQGCIVKYWWLFEGEGSVTS